GHEAPDNLDVVKAAVAMGARILERHVGLPKDGAPLNAYSMDPAQTAAWVESALRMRAICGTSREKSIPPEEVQQLHQLTRSATAPPGAPGRARGPPGRSPSPARGFSWPCPAAGARPRAGSTSRA